MADLLLLRHADAASAAGLPDADRPLTRRGRAAAEALGAHLRGRGDTRIDAALVSTAVRARQTHAALGLPDHEVHLERALYTADGDEVLLRVAALAGTASQVLVVGHNPTLHGLAERLVGVDDASRLDPFPPATLAWLRLPGGLDAIRDGTAVLHALDRSGRSVGWA